MGHQSPGWFSAGSHPWGPAESGLLSVQPGPQLPDLNAEERFLLFQINLVHFSSLKKSHDNSAPSAFSASAAGTGDGPVCPLLACVWDQQPQVTRAWLWHRDGAGVGMSLEAS